MMYRTVEEYAAAQKDLCVQNDFIPNSLFQEYGVNRGLRDVNGVGVLTGLTNISKIESFKNINGKRKPCEGRLWYRGYDVKDLRRSPISCSSATCLPRSSRRSLRTF